MKPYRPDLTSNRPMKESLITAASRTYRARRFLRISGTASAGSAIAVNSVVKAPLHSSASFWGEKRAAGRDRLEGRDPMTVPPDHRRKVAKARYQLMFRRIVSSCSASPSTRVAFLAGRPRGRPVARTRPRSDSSSLANSYASWNLFSSSASKPAASSSGAIDGAQRNDVNDDQRDHRDREKKTIGKNQPGAEHQTGSCQFAWSRRSCRRSLSGRCGHVGAPPRPPSSIGVKSELSARDAKTEDRGHAAAYEDRVAASPGLTRGFYTGKNVLKGTCCTSMLRRCVAGRNGRVRLRTG